MALIKCPDCGKMISSRALKCPDCGCPVVVEKPKMVCPECGEEISEGDSKCPNCGCPISMIIRKTKDVHAPKLTDNTSVPEKNGEAQKQQNTASVINTNISRTVKCKDCGHEISPQAPLCPYCGRFSDWYIESYHQEPNMEAQNGNRFWKYFGAVLFVLFIAVAIGSVPYIFDTVAMALNKSEDVQMDDDPSRTPSFASELYDNTSSQDGDSSSSYSFQSPHDVIGYLSSHEFCKGGNCITFHNMCLYTNGTCATGAVNIISFNEHQAIVEAYSPFLGGKVRFKVDKSYGSLTDLNTGEIYN